MMFDVRVDRFCVGLTEPIHTARGTILEREGFVLVVHDDAGNWGRGELAPLAGWSTVSLDAAAGQLEQVAAQVRAQGFEIPMDEYAPEVRAAVDTAKLSLDAACEDKPLWSMLGASSGVVEVNALVVGRDADDVATNAAEAISRGHDTLKVKLGMGDDDKRLEALAGMSHDGLRVRLDANGAWSVPEADQRLSQAKEMLGDRLEYVEDPVTGIPALTELRALSQVPLAVDETVRSVDDLHQIVAGRLAEVVVVKPPLVGGIAVTLALAEYANENSVDLVVSSLYDGPVGLAAWCHLAAAVPGDRAHGVGTATLLADAGVGHLVPRQGRVSL